MNCMVKANFQIWIAPQFCTGRPNKKSVILGKIGKSDEEKLFENCFHCFQMKA